ncbi:MAG: TetR/AcrR family transcriptional regulator [Solirubrobacterales bacterium]|nr:TetR/AcrR family transcriptional regulator [Solirubrobacterales bacterium]
MGATTRTLIINTACDLFMQRGYNAVTVQDICNACGITKTTFYYHLDSKEAIILDIYDPIVQNLTHHLVDILLAEQYWEQLMMIFEALVKESAKYGVEVLRQLFVSNLNKDSGSFDFRDELTRVAVGLVEKAQQAGQIRNQSPAAALYSASAYAFLGYEVTWCMKGDRFEGFHNLRSALEQIYDVAPALRKHLPSPDPRHDEHNERVGV